MGYTFAVDQVTFPEFWDLVLPRVADSHKQAALAQGFPACRPVQEDGEPVATPQPAATQPLRVVLAWIGSDARADSSDLGPQPLATGKKQKKLTGRGTTDRHRRPTAAQLKGEVRRLRRRLCRYEEELGQLRQRASGLERGHAGDRQ